jgi:hypothetical protein
VSPADRDGWRSLLAALPSCADCDAPAVREDDGVLRCDRHGGGGSSGELPHARLIRGIASQLEQESDERRP